MQVKIQPPSATQTTLALTLIQEKKMRIMSVRTCVCLWCIHLTFNLSEVAAFSV